MKKNILFIIFFAVFFTAGQAQDSAIKFKNYTINDGLSQGSGRSFFIDSNGFLWIGTEDGLNKFDGYNFTVFKNKPGNPKTLSNNWIMQICEDDEKNLWLVTNNNDINKFNLITEEVTRFDINKNIENNVPILRIFPDKAKNIWATSLSKGLYKFNAGSDKYKNYQNNPNDKNSISNNRITNFLEDSKSNLWFGTANGINKYNPKNDNFKRYNLADSLLNIIRQIFEDKSGNIWLAATTGLYKYNPKNDNFIRFDNKAENQKSISSNNVVRIFEDKLENLWIGTANGLNKLNKKNNNFKRYYSDAKNKNSLSGNVITFFLEDKKNNLWITTNQGFCKLDLKTEKFTRISNEENQDLRFVNIFQDAAENIWVMLRNFKLKIIDEKQNALKEVIPFIMGSVVDERTGTVWFGGFGSGIFSYHPTQDKFEIYTSNPDDKNTLSINGIWGLYEDNKNCLWIGTITKGLNKYNPKKQEFTHYENTPNCENCISGNWVTSIAQTGENEMWIGTTDGLNKLNTKTNKFTIFRNIPDDTTSISNNSVNVMKFDGEQTLWIGINGFGLNKLNIKTGKVKRYLNNPDNTNSISSNGIYEIEIDGDELWLSSNNAVDVFNTKTNTFKHYYFNSEDSTGIRANSVNDIYIEDDKDVWFATNGGIAKLNHKTQKFDYWSVEEGLANEMSYCVVHDDFNNIWISTNNGVSRFDKKTEKFYNFDVTDGLQGNEFNMMAYCKTKDGKIYLGGTSGLNAFYPDKIKLDTISPKPVITKLKIFNEDVNILPFHKKELAEKFIGSGIINEGKTYFLKANITYTKELTLSWREKVISFEFAGLHFASPENNIYKYKLENFDENWNNVGKQRFATYTNLPAGEYIFKVHSANSDGIWSKKPAEIKLIITPPWWNTKWFKIIAVIFIISSVSIYVRRRERRLQKQKQKLENQVKERTVELYQQNEEVLAQRDEIEKKAKILNEKNLILMDKNVEINQQKEEIQSIADNLEKANQSIEEIHKLTTDGINYASRIQQAVLPSNDIFKKYFAEHFIFYLPKEVVSGDFYFVKKIKNYVVFTAADCTGHGVPGAFVSLLGISYLNEIIRRPDIMNANQILEKLRIQIKESLKQDNKLGASKDGMDMSLCILNIETNKLQYAGAYNSLYLILNKETENNRIAKINKNPRVKIHKKADFSSSEISPNLIEIKADRQPVSVYAREKPFNNFEIQLEKNDTVYLFSDGYIDQFNYKTGEKFKARRFKDLFLSVQENPLSEQLKILENTFNNWKKDSYQIDDIVVIGVKV